MKKDFKIFLSCSEFMTGYLFIDKDEYLSKRPNMVEEEFDYKVKIAKRSITWNHFSNVTSMTKNKKWKNYCKKFPGHVIFDSGGFQIESGVVSIDKIDYHEVLEKYKHFGLSESKDYGFSLDRPIAPHDYEGFEKYYDFTVGNAIEMKKQLGDIIIPVLQSCSVEHVVRMLKDIGQSPIYALKLGLGINSAGVDKYIKTLMRRVEKVNELYPDSLIFMLGGGGPKHGIITYLMGGDWTDASTWLTRATRASIILDLGSDQCVAMGIDRNRMSIGKVARPFTEQRAKIMYDKIINDTYILDFLDYKDWFQRLSTSAYYRAIHNAWTVWEMERKVNELGSREEVAEYYYDVWRTLPLRPAWLRTLNLVKGLGHRKQTSFTKFL